MTPRALEEKERRGLIEKAKAWSRVLHEDPRRITTETLRAVVAAAIEAAK